jgi:RimJ/RimL family protein N-acetyltransferase
MGCGSLSAVTQRILHSDRLILRPLADEHLEHEVELDSDAEVVRHLSGRGRTREEVERGHRFRMAQGRKVDGLGVWAGFLRSYPAEFVGIWMLQPPHGPSQPDVPGEADLGYRLKRSFWRQGYASEGSRVLVRHGFTDLGLRRVFAQTMAVNDASRATMAAVGLTYVRSFHEHFDEPLPGSELGEVEYELTREDWAMMAR